MLCFGLILVTLEPRLALFGYVLLLLAAATPAVLAWLALLPHEREPFAAPGQVSPKKTRDAFAIFLLANVSLSILFRVPGVEEKVNTAFPSTWLQDDTRELALMIAFVWFGLAQGLAAAYSAARANPIRWLLLAAGALTLALWLAGPWLQRQIAAGTVN
jgi:hypothetical protein